MSEFKDSFLFFLNASFGSYEIEPFDIFLPDRRLLREIGVYFVMSFVFLNILILLNVVIAMMADTYAAMTSFKQGIYNHNILKTAPSYKLDKRYGGLTILSGPGALISFLAMPFYVFIKDRKRLESFNKGFYVGVYTIISLIISTIFLALSFICLPFAYLKTCAHKIKLWQIGNITVCEAIFYILLGLPMGLAQNFFDLWAFLKSSWKMEKAARADAFVISREEFQNFYNVVRDLERKKKPVKAFDLIFKMREMMKLESQVMTLIYGVDVKKMKEAEKRAQDIASARGDANDREAFRKLDSDAKAFLGVFSDAVEGQQMAKLREDSLIAVKAFKQIKRVIWMTSIAWTKDGKKIDQAEQLVNLNRLRIIMDEIKFLLDCHDNGMTHGLSIKRILKRFSIIMSADIEKMIRSGNAASK